ncbi:MAG TPA: hypothetical protein VNW90_16715 [Acetobacteraceae bacterium]|jgi:hypothetical protein|nr:hypothetical protein [Acetobacteraceae bacterium]
MRRRLPRASARLSILLGALCACTQAGYQNVTHPGFGDAEYKDDLAQCRRENSAVVTTQGYDMQSRVTVDEAKAAACMSARGWQKAGA